MGRKLKYLLRKLVFVCKQLTWELKKLKDSDFEDMTCFWRWDENAIDLWIKISNSRQFRNQNQRTDSQIWKVLNFVGLKMWKIIYCKEPSIWVKFVTTDSKSNVSWMVDDGESKGKNLLHTIQIKYKY